MALHTSRRPLAESESAMTDPSTLTEAQILDLDLDIIKGMALDLGYHVTAVEGGYLVKRDDEIENGLEGTDLDTSYIADSEDEAYRTIRREIATMADMRVWRDAQRKKRMN